MENALQKEDPWLWKTRYKKRIHGYAKRATKRGSMAVQNALQKEDDKRQERTASATEQRIALCQIKSDQQYVFLCNWSLLKLCHFPNI